MDLFEKIERSAFLGAEFITWLWFRAEEGGGDFELPGELGTVKLLFTDKLTMRSEALDEQRDSFTGGCPTESAEARTALKVGKLVDSARIAVAQGDQLWSFTLRTEPLMLSQIKLPEVLSEESEEAFLERMYLTEQLEERYHGLLTLFLRCRLSGRWEAEELPAIRAWIQQG